MRYSIFICCLLVFPCSFSFGQTDTQFWFAPPATPVANSKDPVLRIICADIPATVRIYAPALMDEPLGTLSLESNELVSFHIKDYLNKWETYPENQVHKTGLFISSDNPVSVHYDVNQEFLTDIFNLKGSKGIGTKFTIPAQRSYNVGAFDNRPHRTFDIVATSDNTVIRITPSVNVEGHPAGKEFGILLNRGETFSVRNSSFSKSVNLGGSVVISNKPIAISLVENNVIVSLDFPDYFGDQLISDDAAYTTYVYQKGFLHEAFGLVYAIEDDTQIEFDDGLSKFSFELNAGQSYLMHAYGFSIRSSRPVHVLLGGNTIHNGSTSIAGLAVLSGIQQDCHEKSQISFSRTHNAYLWMTLIGTSTVLYNARINGTLLRDFLPEYTLLDLAYSDLFYVGMGFVGTELIPEGTVTLSSDSGSFITTVQDDGNFMILTTYDNFDIPDTVRICDGETYTLVASLGMDEYVWSDGSTGNELAISSPGTYWLTAKRGTCIFSDTIEVDIRTTQIDIGSDTTLCANDTLSINKSEYAYLLWSDNSEEKIFKTALAGKHWVNAVDVNGCRSSDTIQYFSKPYPEVGFGDEIFKCREDTVRLEVLSDSTTALWSTGSNSLIIDVSTDGLFTVVLNRNDCVSMDSVNIIYKPYPEQPLITGSRSVCPYVEDVLYSTTYVDTVEYEWFVSGGEISGYESDGVTVDWFDSNRNASVSLMARGLNGCESDHAQFPVRVNVQLEPELPVGEDSLCINLATSVKYSVGYTNGSIYDWSIVGGTITEGQGTNQVSVSWNTLGQNQLWLTESSTTIDTVCAGTSPTLNVQLIKDPSRLDISRVTVDDQVVQIYYDTRNVLNHIEEIKIEKWRNDNQPPETSIFEPTSNNWHVDVDVETQRFSYEYRLSTLNGCLEEISSSIHNSILLELDKDSINSMIGLRWNNYEAWANEGYDLNIYYKLDKEDFKVIDRLTEKESAYIVDGNRGFDHSFIVEARFKGSGGDISSFSNFVTMHFDHPINFIPNIVTANSDGYNDTFTIPKIELYPGATLIIVNRWGKEVYRKRGYSNEWPQNDISNGVYFYSLIGTSQFPIKGIVTVVR